METRAHHVIVGSFVLGILALVFVSVLWLARVQLHREFAYYDIFFTGSVTGLNKGASVSYKGVQVGRVNDISIDQKNLDRIRVTAEIEGDMPIKEDMVAQLELQGITGYAYVNITGGSSDSPDIKAKSGERHPVIASVPSRLEKVISNAPELIDRAVDVVKRVDDMLNDENRQAIGETLANLRSATAALGGTGGDVKGILVEAATTMKDARAAIQSANRTFDLLNQMLANKDGLGEKVTTAMNDFSAAAKRFNDLGQKLDAVVSENRPGLRDFSQRSLGDLHQLITELRNLVQGLSRVAAEIERDPPRFFFGDRREGYRPR